jgi:hypothetical protein
MPNTVSTVLERKGYNVVTVAPDDAVDAVVRILIRNRIGAARGRTQISISIIFGVSRRRSSAASSTPSSWPTIWPCSTWGLLLRITCTPENPRRQETLMAEAELSEMLPFEPVYNHGGVAVFNVTQNPKNPAIRARIGDRY